LWTRHILNSALLARKVSTGSLADVGSGAGFPGLVVAVMRPDVHCTLIEPLGRRATWLEEEATRLGLVNVRVLNARAEGLGDQVSVDSVTARAVSALKTLIPLCVPLVRGGGELVLMKGQKVDDEIRAAFERDGSGSLDQSSSGNHWSGVRHRGDPYFSGYSGIACRLFHVKH